MGSKNRVSPFTCIGIAPQDLKYAGEPTSVKIGDNNTIRECVTISRGTTGGGGSPHSGDNCLLMASAHIGHDSHVGSNCILANAATLAGHVVVEDFAVVGAFSAIHQFCRVGRHAYIGGGTMATQDVLPLLPHLRRAQQPLLRPQQSRPPAPRLHPGADQQLRHAYRLLQSSKLNTTDALAAMREKITSGEFGEHVAYFADFIANSHRGIIK